MEDKKINDVLIGNEAIVPLIKGVLKAAEIVSSTMGPAGKTVIIPNRSEGGFKYKVTKDGVSVIKAIRLADPVENIGVSMLKEASENTLKLAGDGTTTATVLTKALIEQFINYPNKISEKIIDNELEIVLTKLKNSSKKLNKSDIKSIANISCNGDSNMSDLIVDAYKHSKIVKVLETQHFEDRLELIKGMLLNVGNLTPFNITDRSKNETEFKDPIVVVTNDKLTSLKALKNVLNKASDTSTPVVIFSEFVTESVQSTLRQYFEQTNLKVIVVKTPGFSTHRTNLLNDIAVYTGAKVVKLDNVNISDTGVLESIKVNHKETLLVKHESIAVDEYLEELITQSKNPDIEEYDLELLEQRITNLSGGISQIKVGGKSELEILERKDRYEDAVLAVACALEEGIVEGGGVALGRIATANITIDEDGEIVLGKKPNPVELFYIALLAPYLTIVNNGHEINVNLRNKEPELFDQEIIDPLKVTKTALINAASVAKAILSTKSVVIDPMEWKS